MSLEGGPQAGCREVEEFWVRVGNHSPPLLEFAEECALG